LERIIVFFPFVIGIVCLVLYYFLKQYLGEKERLTAACDLVPKLHNALEKVDSCSTIPARVNNCEKAIKLLNKIYLLDPKGKVVKNRNELFKKLVSAKKVIPVAKSVEKYERYVFKGQTKQALNTLLDAIYHCNQAGISDNDFTEINFRDNTGHLITLHDLKKKATDLGWEGK